MANKRYWLTARIKIGEKPQIRHKDPIFLKAYFDENPKKRDEGEVTEGNGLRVPTEKSGSEILNRDGIQQFDFELTEEEYKSASYKIYFWGEPYGSVAFKKEGVGANRCLGRLLLEPEHCRKGGLSFPPKNSQSHDEQIICDFSAHQSVVDYIVQEMNLNSKSDSVKSMKKFNGIYDNQRNDSFFKHTYYPDAAKKAALNELGCRTHSASDWKLDYLQDALFCHVFEKGGQWDHKPKIGPIWGEFNRLGNSGYRYYYDIWSNIHFGYISAKAGFTLAEVKQGADKAQWIDTGSSNGDDPIDAQAIDVGYMLGGRDSLVTIQAIISAVSRFPEWDVCTRFPDHRACRSHE
ncbi:polymorphic toxin type 44 domain-containing protein [Methylobacterium radiotolerans]|uniref:Bacterial toxin 44 domain-containing protein n=1 Tax=Methylobacterium radiotolerans (strain ATCC 27329 / DSM 1819 / JCM 2831 / NBRC 15690 / NCIMB 10815 / 0-1) TaxID=426355 RepID=B1M1Y0_METRJ|nr:polymorphic toxin type 44 domain-containing protein [Methylobacterium radiotolerans]ACB23165.1 hypothetical protein Mrad2831_1156 [Methylobacterium radiotolerans JCM 2831]GEN00369.1 hypothetical protein MRA01_49080 [Methylobacterium radiotolerans]